MNVINKIIGLILLTSLFSNMALADCDFSTGITPGPNNTYIYSEACHLQVGKLVQQNKTQAKQISDLNAAITLKDLALKDADTRTQAWMNTSKDLEDRLQKVDATYKHNEEMYFALGIVATVAAGFMAARLIHP